MKRKTVLDQNDLLKEVREKFSLQHNEINELGAKFQRYDTKCTGFVVKHEVDDVLRGFNIYQHLFFIKILAYLKTIKSSNFLMMSQKHIQENHWISNKYVDFIVKSNYISNKLNRKKALPENIVRLFSIINLLVDAFVALGGNLDLSGYVLKSTIVNIVKNEFQLTIDMQGFLSGSESDQLDFQQFCLLFEQNDGRSLVSVNYIQYNYNILQSISQRKRNDNQTFQVRYRDFERWLRTKEDQM